MKIAILTDTHFSFKKSNKIFHDYFERFYNDVFFPTLEDRQINCVVHMGDAYDNRKGIDYWGLEWSHRVFYERLRDMDFPVYQICGNHDAELKNTNRYNAIQSLLRDYDNVHKIIEPTELKIGNTECLFIPWICKENENQTFELIKNTKTKIVFGHLELNGFTLFPGQVQAHGLSKDIFSKFDRVFSGHYHTKSNDGKIFYLGNPYQMFWSDVDDSRGFHIFDTETYENEFIKNPYEIFKRIYYSDDDYKTFDYSSLSGKYIKLIIKKKNNQSNYEHFIDKLLSSDILDLKIVETLDVNDGLVDLSNFDCEDTLTILNKYIEQSDFEMDKKSIQKVLYEIYQEALELEV